MQKGHQLEFSCLSCEAPVAFSIRSLGCGECDIHCKNCGKKYQFDDPILLRQLKMFEKLCEQIHASHEILGDTNIGIDIGEHHVKIPFKLLLTRLSSSLDLIIGDRPVSIAFRVETTEGSENEKALFKNMEAK